MLLAPMPVEVLFELARETSARPVVCRARAERPALWPPSPLPSRAEYCRWLALGYSALRTEPQVALELSERASRHFRGDAAAGWLAGQALVALGRYAEADARFQEALRAEPAGPRSASALQDRARAAAMTGDSARAARIYGRLLAQASALASPARRHAATVEAALAQMNAGEVSLAIGTLQRGGRGLRTPGWEGYLQGALGLAYSRAGREVEAGGTLAGVGSGVVLAHWTTLRSGAPPARDLPVLPEADLHALLGVLTDDREERVAHFRRYLELTPEGAPHREHAAERAR